MHCEHARFCVEVFYALYIKNYFFMEGHSSLRYDLGNIVSRGHQRWSPVRIESEQALNGIFSD